MKKIVYLVLFVSTLCVGQRHKTTKLGQTTRGELQMTVYEKDSTANALVLYEHANLYMEKDGSSYVLRTDYYHRIKLFNKEAFDLTTISIQLYKSERITEIKAITYNLVEGKNIRKVHLLSDQVFKTKTDKNWKEVTFTMPDIKEGTVIEYVYSVMSPYFQLDNWYFQSDIPKVKSDYTSAILGNWKYNTRLVGFLRLNTDNPSVKKGCVYIPGIGEGSCLVLSYGMKDIPAFKEEDYMSSKKNFISRLIFDLISFTSVDAEVTAYTKTWKVADRSIKHRYLDGQTSKKNFFKKNLPQKIQSENDHLLKAKKVYRFIQKRFTWNQDYWTRKQLKIKNIYTEKTGGVDAINLTLYNSLQAVNIKSYLVMLSTRSNGLPTKLYPITSDFNYLVVKAVIDGKEYLLDATNKNLPFGLLPERCLNGEGRVLDFKKGGYWQSLLPSRNTTKRIKAQLVLTEEGFKGTMLISRTGYFALNQRGKINTKSENDYLDIFESKYPHIEVESYSVKNKYDFESPLQETFQIIIEEDVDDADKLRINPFFIGRTTENPFKLNQRDYPVDFVYARKTTFLLSLEIPEEYTITKLPKYKSLGLPNKGGSFSLKISQRGNKINLLYRYNLNKKRFSSEEYFYLKEFFKQMIETQSSFIELVRK